MAIKRRRRLVIVVIVVVVVIVVEELVLPTPFLDFPGNALGEAGKTRFFGHKYLTDQRRALNFGPLMEGICAHSPDIFGRLLVLVTREIVDVRRNFGIFSCQNGPRYSCQNFIPEGPWGSPFSALENLDPSPKIFVKFGENFFGGGPPRGAWGQNLRGRPQMRRCAH